LVGYSINYTINHTIVHIYYTIGGQSLRTFFEKASRKSQNCELYTNHFRSNMSADPYPTTILESDFSVFL
jgi:hypothetical protein